MCDRVPSVDLFSGQALRGSTASCGASKDPASVLNEVQDLTTETAARSVSERRGLTGILLATAVVGAIGYVITALVPRVIGVASYSTFAVFWATLFFLVAALSGIQQEVTRATHSRFPPARGNHRVRNFALVGASACCVVILGTAPAWSALAFGPEGPWLSLPLAVGVGGYFALAVLGGTFYGVADWRSVFWLMMTEGVLRLVLVGIALAWTTDVVALAWTVALPVPITVLILALASGRRRTQESHLDVTVRRLIWNSGRTVIASSSMGLLVSGLPLVLSLSSRGVDEGTLGLVMLAATLTRAPLIVVAMALQSYFVVFFRQRTAVLGRTLLLLLGSLFVVGLLLAITGYALGPLLFGLLVPGTAHVSAVLIGGLIATAVLIAALCITGPCLLTIGAHAVVAAGWLTAAVLTTGLLFLPLLLETRVILALAVGPGIALLVHLVYLGTHLSTSKRTMRTIDAS